jgi:hypothetical protein
MTPFKTLYGYDPPLIALRSMSISRVEVIDNVLKERHNIVQRLKDQLRKAQDKIKVFADMKRVERHFSTRA